jgi:hypothetical protein
MASKGTELPLRNGSENAAKPLNRADEVDDVSGCFIIFIILYFQFYRTEITNKSE